MTGFAGMHGLPQSCVEPRPGASARCRGAHENSEPNFTLMPPTGLLLDVRRPGCVCRVEWMDAVSRGRR
jgi:hypothetical protein